MAKFVFYVIDLDEGTVTGTNNVEQVEEFVENDQYIVLHQGGTYWLGSRKENDVQALPEIEVSDDEDD